MDGGRGLFHRLPHGGHPAGRAGRGPGCYLGYAVIAQALGMVGDRYDGSRTATRGELAAMLCRLLER